MDIPSFAVPAMAAETPEDNYMRYLDTMINQLKEAQPDKFILKLPNGCDVSVDIQEEPNFNEEDIRAAYKDEELGDKMIKITRGLVASYLEGRAE